MNQALRPGLPGSALCQDRGVPGMPSRPVPLAAWGSGALEMRLLRRRHRMFNFTQYHLIQMEAALGSLG